MYTCLVGYVISTWLLELKMQLVNPANVLLYAYLKEEQPHVIAVAETRSQRETALSLLESMV